MGEQAGNNGKLVIGVAMTLLTFIGFVIFSLNRTTEKELSRIINTEEKDIEKLIERIVTLEAQARSSDANDAKHTEKFKEHDRRLLWQENWIHSHEPKIESRDRGQWERLIALERAHGFPLREVE